MRSVLLFLLFAHCNGSCRFSGRVQRSHFLLEFRFGDFLRLQLFQQPGFAHHIILVFQILGNRRVEHLYRGIIRLFGGLCAIDTTIRAVGLRT